MKNNKILRRLGCLCLTLLLMLTMLGMTPVYATGVTEITFGEVVSKVGDEVVVPVTIKNNPGFATFRFRIAYDMDDLQFVSVEKGSVLTNGTMSSITNEAENTMTFTWLSVTNDSGDGEIALLKFKISNYARGEYPLIVTYLPEDLLNEDLEQVPYSVVNGEISTGSTVSGTVTSFGESTDPVELRLLENGTEIDKVTSTDGTYSFYLVSAGNYTLEISKTDHAIVTSEIVVGYEDITEDLIIYLKGDVNGDGNIDAKDLRLVKLMLAELIDLADPEIKNTQVDNEIGLPNAKDLRVIKLMLAELPY